MAHLDVSKAMDKFQRKEIWKATKAVCDDHFFQWPNY
jgi:hypothetical protein